MTSTYAKLDAPDTIRELSNGSNRPIVDPSKCLIAAECILEILKRPRLRLGGAVWDTKEDALYFLSQDDGSLAVYGLTEPPQRAFFVGTIPATEWAARGK